MDTTVSQARGPVRRDWSRRAVAALAALFIAVVGCDDEALMPPEPAAGDLFARYAAIGNSITAGFQSGGINDSTQMESYAVLLAEGMGTEFNVPLLQSPGCPRPLTNVFTQEQVGGPNAPDCSLRKKPIPSIVNNAAVPGADVMDALATLGPETNSNQLTTLLNGGRPQIEVVRDVEPTFVTVWIGNGDALNAVNRGDPALLTPPGEFASDYQELTSNLDDIGVQGGLLVGVANAALSPYMSPGAAYWAADSLGALPPTFDVNENCRGEALGEVTFVPFPYGIGILLSLASQGQEVSLDCSDNRNIEDIVPPSVVPEDVEGTSLLVASETQEVGATVEQYNQVIASEAADREWAYYDPNPLFGELVVTGEIPLFPNVAGPEAVSQPFGPLFSKDGIHPNGTLHELIAAEFAQAINDQFGTGLPGGGS